MEAPAKEPTQIWATDRDNVSSRFHELRCCRKGNPASRTDAGALQGQHRFFRKARGDLQRERRRFAINGTLLRLADRHQERLRHVAVLAFAGAYACWTRQFFAKLFERAISLPAAKLGIDCLPPRQIVGQHSPRATRRPAVVDGVNHLARRQLQRPSGSPSAFEQRSNPIPLRMRQVARITPARPGIRRRHPSSGGSSSQRAAR